MDRIPLCNSHHLVESGDAVPFDVRYQGRTCRAFAVRFEGQTYAYLNRCSHIALELDWRPNKVFDVSGRWLLCSNHAAVFEPKSGACVGGPCRSGLVQIALEETNNVVYWLTSHDLKSVNY